MLAEEGLGSGNCSEQGQEKSPRTDRGHGGKHTRIPGQMIGTCFCKAGHH